MAVSMEGPNVDSGDINEIESTELGNQLYLKSTASSPEGTGKSGSAIASSETFIFSWFIHERLRYIKCVMKTDTLSKWQFCLQILNHFPFTP